MQEGGNEGGEGAVAALRGKRILLVIAGGIAAYKCLDLIRRLREKGARVRCILTRAGAVFVTPLSVETLAGETVYTDTLALTPESEIGHIRLGQEADIVVVAPATADIMARMAHGIADDLATATLLAADKPVLAAPAMNTRMWFHPATMRNRARLEADGVSFVGPDDGPLAEGESGPGRMAEVPEIVAAITACLGGARPGPLAGLRVLVTSGPTYEPIDPVRFLGNRSSGKQGHAIAAACAEAGADVLLVSGPTAQPAPAGVETVRIERADEMLAACEQGLPADIAICAAAVSRLAGSGAPRAEAEEAPRGRGQWPALARAGGEPGYPGSPERSRPAEAAPRRGLRRRDRGAGGERRGQAGSEGLRLDPRQWGGGGRCLRRRRQPHPLPHADRGGRCARGRALAEDEQGASCCTAGRAYRSRVRRGHRERMSAPVEVTVQRLAHGRDLPLPAYASAGSAGLDLHAAAGPLHLAPGARALVATGLALALPEGFEGQIRPRSGLARDHGVTVLNSPGTVDSDYRGEIGVLLVNLGEKPFVVERGMRIAQLVIAPVARVRLVEGRVPPSGRGTGGFGSTGLGLSGNDA